MYNMLVSFISSMFMGENSVKHTGCCEIERNEQKNESTIFQAKHNDRQTNKQTKEQKGKKNKHTRGIKIGIQRTTKTNTLCSAINIWKGIYSDSSMCIALHYNQLGQAANDQTNKQPTVNFTLF